MTRKERLGNIICGKEADRPAVCFYELNGIDQNPDNPDEFNVYNDPSWKELLEMTRDRTDRIVLRYASTENRSNLMESVCKETILPNGNIKYDYTLELAGRTFTASSMRGKDVDTVWYTECLFKDSDDLEHFMSIPYEWKKPIPYTNHVFEADKLLGDAGIVGIDVSSPLCELAGLFDMADYLVVAMTEQSLFHSALERIAERRLAEIEAFSAAVPGRLWRIYGPEYAAAPFLPPNLFEEYVVRYDKPIVEAIKRNGGFPRIHSHGNLRGIIDHIAEIGYTGIDPIEPPGQGDMTLAEVRERLGKNVVLFGNIELSEIETLEENDFRRRVRGALNDGCLSGGRGMVLMPSACPIGRVLKPRTVNNYKIMIEETEKWVC